MSKIINKHGYYFPDLGSIVYASMLLNINGIYVKNRKIFNDVLEYASHKQFRSKTRIKFLLFAITLLLSIPALSESVTWDRENGDDGSWSNNNNWNPNIVPAASDDIIINCFCTISVDSDLDISGSLFVAQGTILDMGNKKLKIGELAGASLINNGTIINSSEVKAKGSGPPGVGPFITNTGTIRTKKFHVGNNNGGGMLENTSSGIIYVTEPTGDAMHVDGTICNEGVIHVTNQILFHGAVVTCGGIINAAIIKFEDNPKLGGGASGAGSDIQNQSFGDGDGCSGSESLSLLYRVTGGIGGGPHGNNTYSYQELLDEFGTSDTNPTPQFTVDPVLVTSCEVVEDNTPPAILNFPNDTKVFASDTICGKAVNWIPPLITDDVGLKSITSSHNPGDIFQVGTHLVTYLALDNADNSSEKSFTITVADTISPVINNIPSDISQSADAGSCGAIVNWPLPSVSDNCTASLSVSHNPGDFFDVGTTSVTYTALDIHGNTTVLSFAVTITDDLPPAINNLPNDISQSADAGSCGAIVNWPLPTVSDNCTASLSASLNPGDFFDVGTTPVTYTALDIQGNTTDLSFNVTVLDDDDPVFSFCPTKFTIESIDHEANTSIITWDEPEVEDDCRITIETNYASGSQFAYGFTTIVYTATDLSGNSEVCSFDVGSEYNRPVVVDNITRNTKAGESIDIYLNASDPDGNQVSIESIISNEHNAAISNVDTENLSFIYTSSIDFYGTDTLFVKLIDNGVPSCSAIAKVILEVERNSIIRVSKAITSNGDHVNDFLIIKNIDLFPDNSVHIFDRWGGLLFQAAGYNNESVAWRGTNEQGNFGNKTFTPTGTYFYVIDLGNGSDKITGAVEVIR